MKFSIEQIEQITARYPNMRANTLLHRLRKLEMQEQLTDVQPSEQKPMSFFEKIMKVW